MRKINNNKFRNNNSTIYSLNYKFDSVCVAGKFCGTALDLIKKYNELAKEAHSNGDYVEMEVFRQYAEHYRKIVTEINERKNQQRDLRNNDRNENVDNENTDTDNNLVETEAATKPLETQPVNQQLPDQPEITQTKQRRRRFTLVTVSENNNNLSPEVDTPSQETDVKEMPDIEAEAKPKRRTITRKPRKAKSETNEL